MIKKLGDLTIRELRLICYRNGFCRKCPIYPITKHEGACNGMINLNQDDLNEEIKIETHKKNDL